MPTLPALPHAIRPAVLFTALMLAACGGGGPPSSAKPDGPSGSASPASAPPIASGVPGGGAIDHATGSTDVILRMTEAGGMLPAELRAAAAPNFTLYGNGVIVFQRLAQELPRPDASGVVRNVPWRTAKLDEGQIQELLEFAIGPGGLGAARESYPDDMTADAPDTAFTVRADGVDKTVTITALFEEIRPGPDAAARAAFFRLRERLRDFDRGGTISSDPYQPERFRGALIEGGAVAGVPTISWPWPELKPADFLAAADGGQGGLGIPHRVMTAGEIAALKLTEIDGGILGGVTLKGPDGKLYSFVLRPLLPDEKE